LVGFGDHHHHHQEEHQQPNLFSFISWKAAENGNEPGKRKVPLLQKVEDRTTDGCHQQTTTTATTAMMMPETFVLLLELPVELILAVLGFLSARDLLAVRAAGCRLLNHLAEDPFLWRALYQRQFREESSSSSLWCHTPDKRDLLIYSTAPSGYSLPITIDTIGTARCPATCTPDEVARFGWRLLTVTRMKRSCFLCGAQPSFVVFIDNTRRCSDCVNVEDLIGQAKELAAVANDQGEPHRLARLATVLAEVGKYEEAEQLFKEVLRQDIILHGDESLVVAHDYQVMSQLCKVHSNIYVYVQAEKLELCWNGMEYIRRSLRLYEAHLEKSRSTEENKSIRLRIGEALCLLAGYMCTTSSRVSIDEKVDIERRSLKLLERAFAIFERFGFLKGLADAYRISAGIYADATHLNKEKAMDYLHRSLMIVEMIYGRESIQTADVMQKFGYLYWNWQRDSTKGLEKSLEWHQKELETRCKVMGSTHPITKRTRDDVFIILEKLSREGEANTSAGSF